MDPHKFAQEIDIAIQTYQPGISDLYQLIPMLVGEVQAHNYLLETSRKGFRKTIL